MDKHIYQHLAYLPEESVKNLDWNLIEYYGLISTAENKGHWNRLVGQGAYVIEYHYNKDCAVFFVEYDEFIVITLL